MIAVVVHDQARELDAVVGICEVRLTNHYSIGGCSGEYREWAARVKIKAGFGAAINAQYGSIRNRCSIKKGILGDKLKALARNRSVVEVDCACYSILARRQEQGNPVLESRLDGLVDGVRIVGLPVTFGAKTEYVCQTRQTQIAKLRGLAIQVVKQGALGSINPLRQRVSGGEG